MEYNRNKIKSENVLKQTNINNKQREIIKEEYEEVNQIKSHEFREGENIMDLGEQNYEIRQKEN
jgi:hypothetical protein